MEVEDFFKYYKEQKAIQKDILVLKNYFNESDDFKMDCTPIPIPVRSE